MKRITLLFIAFVLVFVLQCGPSKKDKALLEQAKTIFSIMPKEIPEATKDTPELVALGESLYSEKALSINDQQSCASCHVLDNNRHGVDNLPTSPGALGKNGDRNSPSVLNAAYHFAQFWDGRAPNLKEQAKGPILNPGEMAMPSEKAVVSKISAMPKYKELFQKAYPQDKNSVTYDNLAGAIAAFERTLRTYDRLDDFLAGDFKALNKEEKKGLEVFVQTGCASCHAGSLVGGQMYRKMGMVNPYSNTKDLGRYNVTKDEADKFVFKVPSLRNVKNTAPYFHDGSAKTLEEAVTQMAWLQLGVKLDAEKVNSIVSFLGSLSDKKRTPSQAK